MAKLPRKPTLLKYPKKPRASSSTAVLDRYLDRVKNIDKANQQRLRDYQSAVKAYENEKKRHADLLKKISGIKGPADGISRRKAVRKKKAVGKLPAKRKTRKKTTRKKATRRRR